MSWAKLVILVQSDCGSCAHILKSSKSCLDHQNGKTSTSHWNPWTGPQREAWLTVTPWWHPGDLLATFWWPSGDLMVTLCWPYGDLMVTLWWPPGDLLVISWWPPVDLLVSSCWPPGDILVTSWWHSGDLLLTSYWPPVDLLLTSCWPPGELLGVNVINIIKTIFRKTPVRFIKEILIVFFCKTC